jgi:hypothetical protein
VSIGPIVLDLLTLKQGIILMWAVWMSLVVILNVLDALKMSGRLPQTWKFASGNFWYISEVTKIYSTPAWINWVFFIIVIIWEAVGAVLLWGAWAGFNGSTYAMLNAAWVVNLALWAAFIVMDEIFQAWAAEIGNSNAMEAHRSLFVAWLISLIAIHLLPNV